MPVLEDSEFGKITIRKTSGRSAVRFSVAPNGSLRMSVPAYVPMFLIKRSIESSRPSLRELRNSQQTLSIHDGMTVGKSHSLHIRRGSRRQTNLDGTRIVITLQQSDDLQSPEAIAYTKPAILKALRKEAKAYLPKRLSTLSKQHDLTYSAVRFSHASSRWGSCNHKQSISLNIALMTLPFELIDYVLNHELAHTKHMDHSSKFWALVANADPQYLVHKKALKKHSPAI